jgi:hypothetical protein
MAELARALEAIERALQVSSRAELPAALAELERIRAEALLAAATSSVGAFRPPEETSDQILDLKAAAAFMGEVPAVFLRRPEYLKASIRRPGERKHRFSRNVLERIIRDRLAG